MTAAGQLSFAVEMCALKIAGGIASCLRSLIHSGEENEYTTRSDEAVKLFSESCVFSTEQ